MAVTAISHQSMPERGPGQPQPQPTRKNGKPGCPSPSLFGGSNGWVACCIVRKSPLISRCCCRGRSPCRTRSLQAMQLSQRSGHGCGHRCEPVRGRRSMRVAFVVAYGTMHDCTEPSTSRCWLGLTTHVLGTRVDSNFLFCNSLSTALHLCIRLLSLLHPLPTKVPSIPRHVLPHRTCLRSSFLNHLKMPSTLNWPTWPSQPRPGVSGWEVQEIYLVLNP